MDKSEQSVVLELLAEGHVDEGWPLFLQFFSARILQSVNRFARDDDDRSECYLYVCEHICRRNCRRLRKFDPSGSASFDTWLYAVVYNLCRDWYRSRFPSYRVFRSISRLSNFDQEVFHYHYERRLSLRETYESLRTGHPETTLAQVSASAALVQNHLSDRQRALLQARHPKIESLSGTSSDGPVMRDVPMTEHNSNPESEVDTGQWQDALSRALKELSPSEALVLRLRFERGQTFAEIAKLMGFKNAQEADRRILKSVEKLRGIMDTLMNGKSDQ